MSIQALSSPPRITLSDLGASERRSLVEAVRNLFVADVFQASGHGNASVRLQAEPDKFLLSAPSVLRDLTEEKFALVSIEGEILRGELPPEVAAIIPMHAEPYRLRPDVNSIIHTHSPHATAFAVARKPLPIVYEPFYGAGQKHAVPVAPYGRRGERASIDAIVSTLERHPETRTLLLANHGLLSFGKDARHAGRLVVALEEAAQIALAAAPLGGGLEFLHDESVGASS